MAMESPKLPRQKLDSRNKLLKSQAEHQQRLEMECDQEVPSASFHSLDALETGQLQSN